MAVQYPYAVLPEYYPEGGYNVGEHSYASYVQLADYIYSAGYGEILPLENTGASQTVDAATNNKPPSDAVVVEKRKIVILNLKRDTLSEAVVVHLIAEHAAGLGKVPGEIERVEVPLNKDGQARGIAFVTFISAELASVAIAALDGREVVGGGGKKLEARLAEGVALEGGGGGGGGGGGEGQEQEGHSTSERSDGKVVGGSSGISSENKNDSSENKKDSSDTSSKNTTGAVPPRGPAAWLAAHRANNAAVKKWKEERPVVVNGSEGRRRERLALPVVVDGSAGQRGYGGYRSFRL
jgi:RNA recognition motif-containing protein